MKTVASIFLGWVWGAFMASLWWLALTVGPWALPLAILTSIASLIVTLAVAIVEVAS